MTSSLAGRLLVASPMLVDPNFVRTVVLMLQHDDEGAVGVVLNRPTDQPVEAHLGEWRDQLSEPPVVFLGGPVEPVVAIGLTGGTVASERLPVPGLGVVDLAGSPDGSHPVRVFSGYAGWGPGQLESELDEGAWIVVSAARDDAFTEDPGRLWQHVLRRQGGALAVIATMPEDPTLN